MSTTPRPAGAAPKQTTAPRFDVPALALGLGVPLLAGAAVVVAGTVWAEDLGDRIAVHWGPSGEADGFGSRTGFVALMAGTAVLVPGAMGLFAGLARVWVALRAALLGFAVGTAVLLGSMGVLSLSVQRDGTAGEVGLWVLAALAVPSVAVGILSARVPRDLEPVVLATARPDPDLPRSATSNVAEHGIGMAGGLRVEDGVVVVRWFGRTAVRVDPAEVEAARPVTVSAGSFGGWGLRKAPVGRRYGFIGRGRTGVELTKADGTTWVITTSRAEEVAGAVNTAADRIASHR